MRTEILLILVASCLDMIKRRNLRTRNIKVFVLDEADEMLNKGKDSSSQS